MKEQSGILKKSGKKNKKCSRCDILITIIVSQGAEQSEPDWKCLQTCIGSISTTLSYTIYVQQYHSINVS